MFKMFLISIIFILWYAWSRSMHDKHLFGTDDYKWHWWALQEAIVLNSVLILGLFLFNDRLVSFFMVPGKFIVLWFANAFFFWIIFDMLMGWHAKRDIWYIGVTGFDLKVRNIFLYDKYRGKLYFGAKFLCYVILTLGAYFEYNLNDIIY